MTDPDNPDSALRAPAAGGGRGGRGGTRAEADRDRSLQVQAGRAGLSALRPPQLHLLLRHRHQETGPSDHAESLG